MIIDRITEFLMGDDAVQKLQTISKESIPQLIFKELSEVTRLESKRLII